MTTANATPTSATPKGTPTIRPNDGDRSTLRSPRRFVVSLGLWTFGIVAILSAIVSAALLIAVPMFSLENDLWNRPENPHTFANICLYLAISVVAIVAARGTDRKRFLIGLAVVVASLVYGLCELGLFST